MLGMEYRCQQYYSYQDLKQLQEILKVDKIGIVDINENEQIIKYEIDRSQCLRLSDLIYMINENFVKFHLGQLLTLFTNLLNKFILLSTQYNIDHLYLDDNRIWLIFEHSSKSISIVYNKIDYTIAFTGYQCQQYEEGANKAISGELKIKQIIKDILNQFYKRNIFFNDSKQNEIKKQIYDPIIQFCDKFDIITTRDKILNILQNCGFDNEQQTILFDNSLINEKDLNKRKQYKKLIEQQIKEYVQVFKNEETPFLLENIILNQIKNMISTIENKQQFKKIEKDNEYFKAMKQFYEESQINLKNETKEIIQQIVKDTLQKKLENYKFEITEETKQNLIDNVLNRIINLKLNQYFQNSPHYSIRRSPDHLLFCQLSLHTRFLQQIVNEEVDMLIIYHILLLIDELI